MEELRKASEKPISAGLNDDIYQSPLYKQTNFKYLKCYTGSEYLTGDFKKKSLWSFGVIGQSSDKHFSDLARHLLAK